VIFRRKDDADRRQPDGSEPDENDQEELLLPERYLAGFVAVISAAEVMALPSTVAALTLAVRS
jgi:hypothetical protein